MTTEKPQVDMHDPAGMARWLRERSEAARFFMTMNTAAQRLQFLELWQVNVLPHLAFRFEQAAAMVECLDGDKKRLLGILQEVRDAVRTVDLMMARDEAGNYTNLSGRIDAELTAHTR